MPSPLPGPRTTTRSVPQPVGDGGEHAGVILHTETSLETTPKISVFDSFTNLNDWVTIYGTPTVTAGNLTGEGIVRHKTQALTDSHKASCFVGDKNFGRTRLIICADEAFSRYYAAEIEHNVGVDKVHFIKGTPASSVQSAPGLLGILGSILALLFGLLSIFSTRVTPSATVSSTEFNEGDELSIWYDRPNSTVRIYRNDVSIIAVPVPRGEIPHGEGNRWHGCAIGLEVRIARLGALISSYTCEDV